MLAIGQREIQRRLVETLREENRNHDSLIAGRRDICWREGRVDVVVVNGGLSGFGVKGRRDAFARLPRQVDLYSRVLDHATLVCNEAHVDVAESLIPVWWGLRVANCVGTEVQIEAVREPLLNPWVMPHDLVRLLHHDELYAELAWVRRLSGISRMKRAEMAWTLVEQTDVDELRQIVRERLSQRPSWRAAALRT